MKYVFLACCLLFGRSVFCQQCDCLGNFRYMVEKVEKNYSGFQDKVNPATEKDFSRMTDSLERLAAVMDSIKCFGALRSWLGFFRDRHITISLKDDSSHYQAIRGVFSGATRLSLPEPEFISYLGRNKTTLDSLEGIWEDDTHAYRIGFIRDKSAPLDEFSGFILKADSLFWTPGQVKIKIRKRKNVYSPVYFLSRDHSVFTPAIAFEENSLYTGIFGAWHKVYPVTGHPVSPYAKNVSGPYFRVLDDQDCVIAIPGFGLNYKAAIDSIIRVNQQVIEQRENLIIDLRNNPGGSVLSFEHLLPFIYTQPMISAGGSVLATSDNITNYYALYDYPNISDSMKNVFKKEAVTLRAHEGSLYRLWPADTLKLDAVLPYPRKVAIIINENCASSTELFLLKARQSAKVTIFGKHSMGAIDYSDAVTMKMPCPFFILRYPTSRSARLPLEPLDNIGIQPNVEIPDNTVDWVEFVREHIHYH